MDGNASSSSLRIPWYSALAFHAALLLTIAAVLLHVTTFATNDYTQILMTAVGCAIASMLMLVLAAIRLPRPGRLFALAVGAADAWVIWGAGAERLLGW